MIIIEIGVIGLDAFAAHPERLLKIWERLQAIMKTHQPAVMAIEAPFYAKNAQSMLKLGRAQGVAIAAAMERGLEICEYAPRKIKQSITGNGNARKEQVAYLLQSQFKVDLSGQLLDATDALAAAVCHHNQGSIPGELSRGKSGTKSSWKRFLGDNPDRISHA